MRVKVISVFRDKYTKTLRKVDEIMEITKERFEEINSAALGPFVEEIQDKKPERKPRSKPDKK